MEQIAAMLAKIGVSMLLKFATESFIARVTVLVLRKWAATSETKLDDRVVEAIADALAVPKEQLDVKPAT